MAEHSTSQVAPWLQGLDTAWEELPGPAVSQISAIKEDRNVLSRIPRRNLNGLHSSVAGRKTTVPTSAQKNRSPLATLSSSENNTLRRLSNTTRSSGARSMSETSDGSVIRYDTLQQRAKSSSPVKQGTLEWKKRLLHGKVAYGDQTELFGPSGLDNIFTNPTSTETSAVNKKVNVSWVDRSELAPMPSSPPPWPSTTRPPNSHDLGEHPTTHAGSDSRVTSRHGDAMEASTPDSDRGQFDRSMHDGGVRPQDGQRIQPTTQRLLEMTQDDIGANRTIGGQTELEQEDFSPVFVSKHTTMNGQIGYQALDSHVVKQLHLGVASVARPREGDDSQQPPSDSPGPADLEYSAFTDGPDDEVSMPAPDLSLSENLPTGTPPVPSLGSNVELHRGGYSRTGSFRHRPLSPSQSVADQSTDFPGPELLSPVSTSALQLPKAPSPPHLLHTPAHGDSHAEPKSRSSGSPLKLFGPHDTFTNNRLLRRMSQLDPDVSSLSSAAHEKEKKVEFEDSVACRQFSAASFGSGELNQHSFDAEITITSASEPSNIDSDRSPGSEIAAPGSKIPLAFRFDVSPGPVDTFKLKRASLRQSASNRTVSFQRPAADRDTTVRGSPVEPLQHIDENHAIHVGSGSGKRPPTTPGKDSTPKRRRTLHFSEVVDDNASILSPQLKQLRYSSGARKRKDARKGDDMAVANPDILAQRKILKLRNASPSQRQKEQIEAEIRETAEEFISREPERLEAVMDQIESSMAAESPPSIKQQAQMVANEVAKFSLRVQKASGDQTERKRSVTTQDFFDEAVMVMKLIRERAGRQSVLGSVAESDQEALGRSQGSAVYDEDLSSLRVSRPPSREGGSGWRPRSAQTTDVRILSHLRKFQEKDDTDFIAESMAQLDVATAEGRAILALDEEANIRISAPSSSGRSLGLNEDEEAPDSHRSVDSNFQTHATNHSAGTSTARTLPTSSTRKSENVGTLGPDAVAHLIGDHVGGMVFDKEKRQWVRSKGGAAQRAYGSFLEPLSTITSDDDPFREISDLPVDEAKEEEIRKASCTRNLTEAHQDGNAQSESAMLVSCQLNDSLEESTTHDIVDPVGNDGQTHHANVPTSDPSDSTASHDPALCSSQQQQEVETRATSWSDEEMKKLGQLSMARTSHLMMASALKPSRPISLLTTQSLQTPSYPFYVQTGPLDESVVHQPNNTSYEPQECTETFRDESIIDQSEYSFDAQLEDASGHGTDRIQDREPLELSHAPPAPIYQPSVVQQSARRQVSLRRKTLNGRLNAEAMEQSELSFVAALPGERKMTVSLSLSRPVSGSRQPGTIIGPLSSPKLDQSFMLSDLPDFTISEEDPERPSEQLLAHRLAKYAVVEANDRFSLTVKDLVKTLSDVNEGDPYWKELQRLSLHGRALDSLYGLDEFCASIQDIDLSCNAIAHLGGAPSTIRHLTARSNLLSSLTSWTHLVNLQYLDISGNNLDDLSGLGCLFHLRELRADDNQIASIDGVQHLDGLLRLRVRRNRISAIDLHGARLQRLEELDACHNDIREIQGLGVLTGLKALRLDNNPLQRAPVVDSTMSAIRHLSLQYCNLHSLDVTPFPSLQTVHLDGNHLSAIDGIEIPKSLDLLSLRRQILLSDTPVSILSSPLEARILRLSGTPLSTLPLPVPLLSLQHLDLASCGLASLPEDFGLRFPNLRTLNLNFNSIKDLRPLLNIHSLERLHVAGNLIARLRKTAATLGRMPALLELDLRDNPLTLGFHAPLTAWIGKTPTSTIVVRRASADEGASGVEDEDDVREEAEEGKYKFPDRDEEAQRAHLTRMEEGIALRRRVYLMLLTDGCAGLKKLDGGPWHNAEVRVRDGVWERLVELGIVKKSSKSAKKNEGATGTDEIGK